VGFITFLVRLCENGDRDGDRDRDGKGDGDLLRFFVIEIDPYGSIPNGFDDGKTSAAILCYILYYSVEIYNICIYLFHNKNT